MNLACACGSPRAFLPARERPEQVGKAIQVGHDVALDTEPVGPCCRDTVALGPTNDYTRDIEQRADTPLAGQYELGGRVEPGGDVVDHRLHRRDHRLGDPSDAVDEFGAVLRCGCEFGAGDEQLALVLHQQRPQFGVGLAFGAGHAQRADGFVDGAVGTRTDGVLTDAPPVEQTGGAVVARLRVHLHRGGVYESPHDPAIGVYGAAVVRFAGIIEGFYGPPWSWDDRVAVCRHAAGHGCDTYVYAPKSDPLHREEWRTPYDSDALAGFERLCGDGGVRVGFAVSPGLSMQHDDPADRAALVSKFAALRAVGVDLFCLALDDIPAGPEAGRRHGELCAWLLDALTGAHLLLVPTDYTSITANPYLDGLAATVPPTVGIAWTGPTVVADLITAADAGARAAALGGRRPWLWDNTPVNDGVMTERLFMSPLRGREPALRDAIDGYLANPMLHARASQLPLASAMAWCRGGDPETVWLEVAHEFGWLDFARACDDTYLRSLGADDCREFLTAVTACEAPGIDAEVGPWLRQVRREAKVALRMLDACASGDAEQFLVALAMWSRLPDPDVPNPAVSVFGPRRSIRPVIAQDEQVRFVARPGAVDVNRNAIDDLVVTLAESAGTSGETPK